MRCVFRSQTRALTLDIPAAGTSAWRAATRLLRSPLRPALDALSCALYPAACLVCTQPLLRLSRAPVCDTCWNRLRPQSAANPNATLCARCEEDLGIASFSTGHPRPSDLQGPRPSHPDLLCQPCRLAPPPFVQAVAFGVYGGELRALVHLLKYRRIPAVARGLGRRLASAIAELPALPADLLVIPVPLYKSRGRRLGFNHAELIARATVAALRPLRPLRLQLAPGLLLRTRATESQAALTPRGRRRNLRGAFAVPPAMPGNYRLAGRHILLIDDIYTTGATARACSSVLLRAGAASVTVATVARAQREGVALWDADASLGAPSSPLHQARSTFD